MTKKSNPLKAFYTKESYLAYLRQQKREAYEYDDSWDIPRMANSRRDLGSRLCKATLGSLGLSATFTIFSNMASNAPLKQEHIAATMPEREAFIESVKADLKNEYPALDTTDMDSTNVTDVLYNAYKDSYNVVNHGGWRGAETIVKEDMKNYYIDFNNHKFDYITDTLDNMANDFEHYPLLDSLRDVVPAGVAGAVLCFAWAMYPLLRAKHKVNKIDREIALVEAEINNNK